MSGKNPTNDRSVDVGVILGGAISPERRLAALQGAKPRIDAMEMEEEFTAQLYDYEWLAQKAKQDWIARILLFYAKRFGQWSESLCLRAVWSLRDKDVIYATGEDVGLPLATLLRLFRFKSPRLIIRTEQPIYGRTRLRRFLFTMMFRFAVQRIDLVSCRTQAHATFLQQQFKLPPTKAIFSPETTDTKFFNGSTPSINLSSLNSIPRPYLVSAGMEMRDYDTLISAVEGLPITALICAGSPWAKAGHHVFPETLPPNVITGSFSQTEMRELYRSAAFVVLPVKPTQRACGMNVILEAWAMGRSVIASRTEGLCSYIQDRVTGYFVTPENVEELREAITYFLANPPEAERLGQNGYRKVTSELYMERYIENVGKAISTSAGETG